MLQSSEKFENSHVSEAESICRPHDVLAPQSAVDASSSIFQQDGHNPSSFLERTPAGSLNSEPPTPFDQSDGLVSHLMVPDPSYTNKTVLRKSRPTSSSSRRESRLDYREKYQSSVDWIKHPICSHCGSITPRSGITTVYGTPTLSRSFMDQEKETGLIDALVQVQDRSTTLCLVEKVNDKDDVNFLPLWKQKLHRLTPYFSMVAMVAYWLYFSYRIFCTRSAEKQAKRKFGMAWTFIAVEMGVATPMLLHQFWNCFLLKTRFREKLRVVGNQTPTVDVFITCCGEDNDIIMDTVRAAADQDWPYDRFRVVILDDGRNADLAQRVEAFAATNPHVFYYARPKIPGVPHHFKAGNLNGGLQYVSTLEGGRGEYIAALDADMIPERDWLRAVTAHIVLDPAMALTCPPQLFYNVPSNDPLLQSLNAFVHISEPVKDAAGVAWCTGSGYAIRRSALDEIGGFPIGSLAEDVCTSSMLLGNGWKTAYIHEPLQFGTVPDSFVGHMKQRIRWTIGTIQTAAKLNFCLFGPYVRHMTILQRLSGFVYTVSSLFTIFLTLSLFTVPIVLVSGGTLIAFASHNQLRWLIRLCFFALISNRINEWITFMPAGYRLGRRESSAMMWMAPFQAIAIVRSFLLPKWLGGKVAAFSSTGSIVCELNERDPKLRAPLMRRLRVILIGCMMWIMLVYILFCVSAVITSLARAFTTTTTGQETLLYLLTHIAWPPLLWLIILLGCWSPIHYAIWPPNMPAREELLDRDPVTLVAHPKLETKKIRWDRSNILHELLYICLTAYTTAIFVGSWFY